MLSLIVAHDHDFVIGYQGWMPWKLKEDLQVFKAITLNHTIVMGKTTFMGMKKPLPQRKTVVVTRDKQFFYDHEDVLICNDLAAFIKDNQYSEEEIIVCGGAQLYTECLPYVEKMYISLVEGKHDADTFFPIYNMEDFKLLKKVEYEGFSFLELERKVI